VGHRAQRQRFSLAAEHQQRAGAENRSVAIDGAKLVYRRFGNAEMEGPPLVCLQHFRGNLTSGIRRWSIASLRIAR
jgi:hypothetical protein